MTKTSMSTMVPSTVHVLKIIQEIDETVTLVLDLPSSLTDFYFTPGQFNMLYSFGQGEIPVSFSGNQSINHQIVHTIRSVGAVSQSLVSLKVGQALGIRGPFGQGFPMDRFIGKEVIIVGGGLGLAPLRPVIYFLKDIASKVKKATLLIGAKNPNNLLYSKEVENWKQDKSFEVHTTFDQAPSSYKGPIGLITNLIPRITFNPLETIVLVCGPEIMMKSIAIEFEKKGVNKADIYMSLERNMKCALGFCGHCQLGPDFICREGPVLDYKALESRLRIHEI